LPRERVVTHEKSSSNSFTGPEALWSKTQLYIAHELWYLGAQAFDRIQGDAVELDRVLNGLIKNIDNQERAA